MSLGDDFGQVDQEAADATVSRRFLVRRALGLVVATPVVLTVLQACGGDEAEAPAGGGDTEEETGGGAEQETGGGAEETEPAMTAASPAASPATGASPAASPAAGASPVATPMAGASPVASPVGAQAGGEATPAS